MSIVKIALAAALSVALAATSYALAVGRLITGAIAEEPAVRDVAVAEDVACDLTTAAAVGTAHPDVRQLVLMITDDFGDSHGDVTVAVRDDEGTWRCQRPMQPARFGRNGTRPLPERRSGDGTTPAGVFPLGTVTAWDGQELSIFGNRSDPGVLVPYRRVQPDDCWGATPNTARYQHLVRRPGCTGPDEWLPRYGDVYSHAAVIGANLDPISGDQAGEPPLAAAIFLHRHSYATSGATRPTSGCVSLAYDDLVATIRILDARLGVHFAIGPRDWLRGLAPA